MKIIFLDIDGVLNGYNFWNILGWKIISLTHSKKLKTWYRNTIKPFGVHENKVKRLAKIVKNTDAKIVMSSSWRIGWWKTPYEKMGDDQKKLTDLFNKYNIKVIDITPYFLSGNRGKEIVTWLAEHEEEVEKFIILDDENTHLRVFDNDERFIQTSSVSKGKMIKGYWYENTGLKNKHVRQAIYVLNKYPL